MALVWRGAALWFCIRLGCGSLKSFGQCLFGNARRLQVVSPGVGGGSMVTGFF